jgi:hypothetical protein
MLGALGGGWQELGEDAGSRSCQIPEGIGPITLSPDVETSRSTEDLTAKINLQLRIDTN